MARSVWDFLLEIGVKDFARKKPGIAISVVVGLCIAGIVWFVRPSGNAATNSLLSKNQSGGAISQNQSGGIVAENLYMNAPSHPTPRYIVAALSQGRQTVVKDDAVRLGMRVRCGCEGIESKETSCNDGGRWLAHKGGVSDVGDGTFTIAHAYATGNERVVCAVE